MAKFKNIETFDKAKKALEKVFKKEGIQTPLFGENGEVLYKSSFEVTQIALHIVYSAFRYAKNSAVRAAIHSVVGNNVGIETNTEYGDNNYCCDIMSFNPDGEPFGSLRVSERWHSFGDDRDKEIVLEPLKF